jgi:hypothetical protein
MTRQEDWLADDEGNLRPEVAEMLQYGSFRPRPAERRNPPRGPGRGLAAGTRRVLGVTFVILGLLVGSNAAHRDRSSPRPHTPHVPVVQRPTEAPSEGQGPDRPLRSPPVSQPIARAAEVVVPKPVQQEVELSVPRPLPSPEDPRIATARTEDWRVRAWMKDRARSRVKTRPVTRVEARPARHYTRPSEVRIAHVRQRRPACGAHRVAPRVLVHRPYRLGHPVRVWVAPRHRVPPRRIPGPPAQVRHLKKGRP